jgi:S-DNA-T family DNA segregation ATPase FtsK/SpoIIIE
MIAAGSTLAAAPLVTSLPDSIGIALSGDGAPVNALGRWLVAQIATLHSPRDVVLAAALSAEREPEWRALRWLPHLGAQGSPVDHDHLAVGAGQAASLVQAIGAVAQQRRSENRDRFAGRAQRRTHVVLVLDEAVAPARALVEDLLAQPEPLDIALIWLGRVRRDVPGGCGTVVLLGGEAATMAVAWPADGRQVGMAIPDGVDASVADAIARDLAPVRDAGSAGAAADIPRAVSLLELLDLVDITPTDVQARWGSRGGLAIDAVIGHRGDGPLALDLRADGPHALVAGTTGAGKSELLQALVVSLALNHPPQRLSLLFVDYKGGAAFKDCVRLPHSAGMVTDLDTHLVRRALLSLNAELRRREKVLHDHGVKDLVELERRHPAAAPASLVIVIDEFAALKTEVPEFVDGVVDIAQRGRSLGVHLVLATQRPAGIVSDNIRANTNLRVALRVSDPSESSDVVGDPVAARIARSMPGRGFLRTGHSELTEFQSAYVGGHSIVQRAGAGIVVRPLVRAGGAAPPAFAPVDDEQETDLERTVQAIGRAADQAGEPLPPAPWLPPLPEILALDELGAEADSADCAVVPLGVVDDPARQRQYVLRVDLQRDGHLLVYGTSGSGKTTLLRSIAVSLATRAGPDQLHLYALDCTGRGLLALEALPHCGAVILGDDEERVRRLFTLLRRAIDERSRLFAERGVSTLAEYAQVAGSDAAPARIVLLLDSYAGFMAAFERVELGALVDALARIVSDGRAAGVHLVATADRRNAVPHTVASLIPRRLVLRQADEDDYGTLGLDRRATRGADLPPGRGFAEGSLEIQTPLIGDDPSGEGVAAAIAARARALEQRYSTTRAPALLKLPEHHPRSALPPSSDPALPYVGIDETDHAPVCIDLYDAHFLVTGPHRSGRTTALATIVDSARRAPAAPLLHLLAPRRSALLDSDVWETSARGHDACVVSANTLLELVHERSPDEPHDPVFVVIDDADELSESLAATALETLARRGRDVNVRIIASCENSAARGYSPWIGELRKDGSGLLLSPDVDLDGDLLAVRLPRRSARALVPGRGYLVSGGRVTFVQVAGGAS